VTVRRERLGLTIWPRGPRLALVMMLASGLGLVTWQVLSGGWMVVVDVDVRRWTVAAPSSGRYGLLYAVTLLGQRAVTAPIVVIAAAVVGRRTHSWRPLLGVAGSLAVLAVSGEAFKLAVGRLAPHASHIGLHAGGLSFPGGHAANIVLTGGLLLRLLSGSQAGRAHRRMMKIIWMTLSLLVGVATVVIGFHWATDVVAGWLFGGLLLIFTPSLAPPTLPSRPLTGSETEILRPIHMP